MGEFSMDLRFDGACGDQRNTYSQTVRQMWARLSAPDRLETIFYLIFQDRNLLTLFQQWTRYGENSLFFYTESSELLAQ